MLGSLQHQSPHYMQEQTGWQVCLRHTCRAESLPAEVVPAGRPHGRRLRRRAPSRAVGGAGPGHRPRRVAHTALRGSEHAGEPASAGARERTASRHVNGAPYANRLRAPAFGTAMRSACSMRASPTGRRSRRPSSACRGGAVGPEPHPDVCSCCFERRVLLDGQRRNLSAVIGHEPFSASGSHARPLVGEPLLQAGFQALPVATARAAAAPPLRRYS